MAKKKSVKKKTSKKENKIKHHSSKLKKELKKSMHTAIIAAFGFLVALSWRDLIGAYVEKITAVSVFHGQLISTIIITLIATIGILITTKLLGEDEQ